MSKLYTEEGDLDLAAAAVEVVGSSKLSNEGMRRDAVARVTAAALLDIAGSLRTLSLESALAMSQGIELDDEPRTDAVAPPLDVTECDAGTPVRLKAPDHKGRQRSGILNGIDGIDSGEAWVGVYWDDAPDNADRVYAANLEVVPLDERDDGLAAEERRIASELVAQARAALGLPNVEDLPNADDDGHVDRLHDDRDLEAPLTPDAQADTADSIDDDFAEVDPIAVLEARQAKSKKGKAKK